MKMFALVLSLVMDRVLKWKLKLNSKASKKKRFLPLFNIYFIALNVASSAWLSTLYIFLHIKRTRIRDLLINENFDIVSCNTEL